VAEVIAGGPISLFGTVRGKSLLRFLHRNKALTMTPKSSRAGGSLPRPSGLGGLTKNLSLGGSPKPGKPTKPGLSIPEVARGGWGGSARTTPAPGRVRKVRAPVAADRKRVVVVLTAGDDEISVKDVLEQVRLLAIPGWKLLNFSVAGHEATLDFQRSRSA